MARDAFPRRSLLRLAALGLPALGLAACGLAPNLLPQQPAITTKPVTLNLYYGPFFVQGGGQSPEGKLLAPIVADFHKAHPNVTVNATEINFGMFNDVQTLTDPGNPSHADLLLGQFVGRFGNIDVQGALTPVDTYLKRDRSLTPADFYPAALHLWWRNGTQLGLPRDIQPNNVIYYNRDRLKAAGLKDPADGWTTDDFLAFLQQLAQAGQQASTTKPQHWAYVDLSPNQGLLDFITIFGGRATNYPQTPPRAMFDTSQAIDGARFYVDLYTKYHDAPDNLNRAGSYSLSPVPEFLLGNVPLMLAPTNLIPTMQSVQHPLDWDLTLEPIKSDVKQSWYGSGTGGFMMKAVSDADTGWDLLTYLIAGDGMKRRAVQGDVHPAVKKIAESSAYSTGKSPLGKRLFNSVGMQQMIDVDPSTLPPVTPVPGTPVPGSYVDTTVMYRWISDSMDDLLTGKADPAELLREATQKANATYKG